MSGVDRGTSGWRSAPLAILAVALQILAAGTVVIFQVNATNAKSRGRADPRFR